MGLYVLVLRWAAILLGPHIGRGSLWERLVPTAEIWWGFIFADIPGEPALPDLSHITWSECLDYYMDQLRDCAREGRVIRLWMPYARASELLAREAAQLAGLELGEDVNAVDGEDELRRYTWCGFRPAIPSPRREPSHPELQRQLIHLAIPAWGSYHREHRPLDFEAFVAQFRPGGPRL